MAHNWTTTDMTDPGAQHESAHMQPEGGWGAGDWGDSAAGFAGHAAAAQQQRRASSTDWADDDAAGDDDDAEWTPAAAGPHGRSRSAGSAGSVPVVRDQHGNKIAKPRKYITVRWWVNVQQKFRSVGWLTRHSKRLLPGPAPTLLRPPPDM